MQIKVFSWYCIFGLTLRLLCDLDLILCKNTKNCIRKWHSLHKMHLLCGQKALWNALHPHRIPMAWMKVFICNRLSTKRVPGVDERCQKDAVPPQRSIFCGSKMLSMTVHPQKIPYLWTKGIYKNNSSTKDTLFVDKSGPKYLHKPKKPCISARLFLWCHQEMSPISKWLYILH